MYYQNVNSLQCNVVTCIRIFVRERTCKSLSRFFAQTTECSNTLTQVNVSVCDLQQILHDSLKIQETEGRII